MPQVRSRLGLRQNYPRHARLRKVGADVTLRQRQILLASGYNKPRREPPHHRSHECETRPIWTLWGQGAVDRKRLTWLIVNWCFRSRRCFTCQFRFQYRRTRREVFPILNRVQNIGYEMGENNRTAAWYRANHRTPWVARHTDTTSNWTLNNLRQR